MTHKDMSNKDLVDYMCYAAIARYEFERTGIPLHGAKGEESSSNVIELKEEILSRMKETKKARDCEDYIRNNDTCVMEEEQEAIFCSDYEEMEDYENEIKRRLDEDTKMRSGEATPLEDIARKSPTCPCCGKLKSSGPVCWTCFKMVGGFKNCGMSAVESLRMTSEEWLAKRCKPFFDNYFALKQLKKNNHY